jgi:hypothetical protein
MNNKIQHKTQCTACGNVDLLQDSLMGESVKILDADKAKEIREDAIKTARDSMNLEFQDLKAQIAEKDAAVQKATEIELASRKRERDVKEQQVHLDIEVEKRLSKKTEEIREKVQLQADEKYRSTIAEMNKANKDIKSKLDSANRAAQGRPSQQLQGEASEVAFEEELRAHFPEDILEPIVPGASGADIKQIVRDDRMNDCGIILYEKKETESWRNDWVEKLKCDVEAAGADIAFLVTKKLPRNVKDFVLKENVWVVQHNIAIPVISSIRYAMREVEFAKNANVDVEKRIAMGYNYLTSPQFRYIMEKIIQAWTNMKTQLDKEKRVISRTWKERETLLSSVTESTISMYGNLKAIMGNKIEDIPELEFDSLDMLTEGMEAHDEAAL